MIRNIWKKKGIRIQRKENLLKKKNLGISLKSNKKLRFKGLKENFKERENEQELKG